MKTLYNVTYRQKDGLRVLLGPAQGRFMKAAHADALLSLGQLLLGNTEERVADVYGAQAVGTFRVDRFDCYDHGDPMGIYVDDERNPYQEADTAFAPLIAALVAKGWPLARLDVLQTGGWCFCLSLTLRTEPCKAGERIKLRALIGDPRHDTFAAWVEDPETGDEGTGEQGGEPTPPTKDPLVFAEWLTTWLAGKGYRP